MANNNANHLKAKILSMLVPLLLSATASAEIQNGHFVGHLRALQDVRREVQVFIQSEKEADGENSTFGLILDLDHHSIGAIFRIEELPDGTQSWIHLYQGEGHYLTSNTSESAALKGVTETIDRTPYLKLVPAEGNPLCGDLRDILVETVNGDRQKWLPFPQDGEINFFSEERRSHGVLKNGQFTGDLVFNASSHDGTFALGNVAPEISTLRAKVLSPKTISGWSLAPNLLGVGVLIFHNPIIGWKHIDMSVIELPVKQESCFTSVTTMSNR